MPDAFTHIAIPTIFYKYFKYPIIIPIALIGTVLPDYFRELFKLFLSIEIYPAVYIFHSIIGVMCTSLLISAFFIYEIRIRVFISLLFGQCIHLLFDMFQVFICGSRLYLFFPLKKTCEIGLFSESHWLYIFVFSLIVFLRYIIYNLYFKKRELLSHQDSKSRSNTNKI